MAKRAQFFITGTDTDVGKTVVSAALLHAAGKNGLKTLGLKPVSAGCEDTGEGLRNGDALSLMQHSNCQLPYAQVNPIALEPAIAPHIAAAHSSKRLSADRIVGICRGALMTPHDFALVEGAGGWRVPLSERESMADIAIALGLPVILVVGMRLGCLNHALLTAEAIARDGLPIAGWVANHVDPHMAEPEANVASLVQRFPFPMLGRVPYQKGISPADASVHLDINKLLHVLPC